MFTFHVRIRRLTICKCRIENQTVTNRESGVYTWRVSQTKYAFLAKTKTKSYKSRFFASSAARLLFLADGKEHEDPKRLDQAGTGLRVDGFGCVDDV